MEEQNIQALPNLHNFYALGAEEWARRNNIDRANRIKADLAELRYAMPETIEGNKRASELEEAGYLIEEILDTLGAY